jgi:hypothetical protein
MKLITKALIAAVATMGMSSAASAIGTVTLADGCNCLDAQIHLDPGYDASAVYTVHGLTKPGDLGVSFLSTALIDGTGGSGYAQISDASVADSLIFKDLDIFMTAGLGITAYEFTIQFDASKQAPQYLTIGYDLVGGGSGSFSYLSGDPVLGDLLWDNNQAKDFRLEVAGGAISHIYLTSASPIIQVKQTMVDVVGGVPEPGTWAMMIFGFGAAGVAMRRSRRKLVSQLV